MSNNLLKNLLLAFVAGLAAFTNCFAQNTDDLSKRVNFGYSQNPKTKSKEVVVDNKSPKPQIDAQIKAAGDSGEKQIENDNSKKNSVNTTVAKKTLEIAKRAVAENVSPTEIYKVGVGDILFISLQNASSGSTYYTVLNDGTIDYPLAGQMVAVAGLTSEEIEDLLKEKIKLFENPQVSVRVREHASHAITVLGLVEKAGEKFLPREAMPLYFVRAEAVVQSKANQAVVKHSNSGSEILDLNDAKNDNVLIFPGDIVEFKYQEIKENNSPQPQFIYIGGYVVSVGQKDFYKGLTLTQAIFASGGLRKPTVRKIIIRRKNTEGLLVTTEVNLKAVYEGKVPDPLLEAGDTIEVGN